MPESKELNSSGIIRLLIFTVLIIGCLYLGVSYSVRIAKIGFIDNWLETSDIGHLLMADGSDLRPILIIASYMIKSYGIGFIIITVLICFFAFLLLSLIPFLIFRAASIRRDSYISETEYKFTKRLFFAAFIIGIIMPVFFSGFKCLFWSPVLNFAWFLSALVYVITIENRHLAGQRAAVTNNSYTFESMPQMQTPIPNGTESQFLPPNFNHPDQGSTQNTAQSTVQPQNPYQPRDSYQPNDPYQPQNPITNQSPYQPQQNPYRNPYDPDSKY